MSSHQKTKPSPPAAAANNVTTAEDTTAKDKELATLIIAGLLIASCHPCLSQEIATRLQISTDAVRNTIMSMGVAVSIAALMLFKGKNKNNIDATAARQQ